MGDMSSQDADLSCHNFHRTQSNWYILPLSAESPHISHRTLEINKEQIIYGKYTLCWIIVSAMLGGGGGGARWVTLKNANTNHNLCEAMCLYVLGDGAFV